MSLSEENAEIKRVAPYFPFWYRDFVHSVRNGRMTFEEIGALTMLMCNQWDITGPVPTPEIFAAFCGCNIRIARRLLDRLVEIKKVSQAEAGYTSERMTKEIERYVGKVKSALVREERKRSELANVSQTSAKQVANVSNSNETFAEKLSEIAKEINDSATTEAALLDSDSDSDSERKKEITPLPPKGGDEGRRALEALKLEAARQAFGLWKDFAKRIGLPIPRESTFVVSGKKLGDRLYEHADAPKGIPEMLHVYRLAEVRIERSRLCRGENDRKWKASFEFLTQKSSFVKLLNGVYGNGAAHVPDPTPPGVVAPRIETPQERADRLWAAQQASQHNVDQPPRVSKGQDEFF